MTEVIKVPVRDYKKMQRELAKLAALEAGGVDNWEWYGESLSAWSKENDIDEFLDDAAIELHEYLAEAEVEQPAGSGCGYSVSISDNRCRDFFEWFIKKYEEVKGSEE